MILGRNTEFPVCRPVTILAWIIFLPKWIMDSLVPFSSPSIGLILRKRTIGAFVFKYSLCGGVPENVNELRHSVGYKPCCSSSGTLSALSYVLVFSG